MRFLNVLFASFLSGFTFFLFRKQANLSLMRFFRNLSRYKARKRLYGNEAALIPLLLGQESIIIAASKWKGSTTSVNGEETESEIAREKEEEEVDFYMTKEQLATMNGATASTPIYICVKGRIYDVSAAREMYGPGEAYHVLVGKDATRAFATGCLEGDCVTSSTVGLTAEELEEIDRWVDLYQNHDKYQYIGKLLADDPIDSVVDNEIASSSQVEEKVVNTEETVAEEVGMTGEEVIGHAVVDESVAEEIMSEVLHSLEVNEQVTPSEHEVHPEEEQVVLVGDNVNTAEATEEQEDKEEVVLPLLDQVMEETEIELSQS